MNNITYANSQAVITDLNLITFNSNTTNRTTTCCDNTSIENFNDVSQIPFTIDEYKIIMLLKNGTSINQLTFKQLILLSKLYSFSETDLIELQDNIQFIQYLHDSGTRKFLSLSNVAKQNIQVAKMAVLDGVYSFIEYIPPEHQTTEIYNKFIECCNKQYSSYAYISYLANNLQTAETWYKAFDSDKFFFCKKLFALMPDKFKTQNFCLKVCNYLIDSFRFVPENLKTFELCKKYILHAINVDITLIPENFKNELQDLLLTRIKSYGTNFEYKRIYRIIGLETLPDEILKNNPDVIIKSCILFVKAMEKFNPTLINDYILLQVAKATIENIPKKYMGIELILARLKYCSTLEQEEKNIVDNYFINHKDKIQPVALQRVNSDNNLHLLRYIPDYLTEDKCYQYINQSICNYYLLPDNYKFNVNVIIYMLTVNLEYIDTLNSPLLTTESYQIIFTNYPKVSGWRLNPDKHAQDIEKKVLLLNTIPKQQRTLDIWLYLCNNKNRDYIDEIPKNLLTQQAFCYLVDEYTKWNNIIDYSFVEKVFHHQFFSNAIENKLLVHSLQCISRSSDVLFFLMKSAKIPQNFKNSLLDNIKIANFYFEPTLIKELYSKVNPIQRAVSAKFVTELLSCCYKKNHASRLILPKTTQHLKEYITAKKISQLPLDNLTDSRLNTAKITGGRTIQVDISTETAFFYKFRKPKEKLIEFVKEGYIFDFFHHNDYGKSLKHKLKSSIPELQKMVRIPVSNLPKHIFNCEDGIDKFIDNQNIECVDVLVFSASIDYLKYAHKLDSNNKENPYQKAEAGILKACHDIGLFTSIGIYHTSTLPAYHFAGEGREWGALHMLFRKITVGFCRGELKYPVGSDINMVGKLEKWATTATNRPDYGYTGLRDFGDCEFFGEILGALQYQDSKNVKNFPIIIQNILAVNTICECLLAAVLLYSRMHKTSIEYHYRNNEYKHKIASFIEEIFSSFLTGRFQNNNINLAKFMQLSTDDYNKWLDRTVTEILYWTAEKHDAIENQTLNIDVNDHVTEHIKNRKLPEDLYDNYDILSNHSFKFYYDNTNLGCDNATFPLLALMKFIFLFNVRLHDHIV